MYGSTVLPGAPPAPVTPRRRALRWVLGASSVALVVAVARHGRARRFSPEGARGGGAGLDLQALAPFSYDPHTCNATATMSALASVLEACESAGGARARHLVRAPRAARSRSLTRGAASPSAGQCISELAVSENQCGGTADTTGCGGSSTGCACCYSGQKGTKIASESKPTHFPTIYIHPAPTPGDVVSVIHPAPTVVIHPAPTVVIHPAPTPADGLSVSSTATSPGPRPTAPSPPGPAGWGKGSSGASTGQPHPAPTPHPSLMKLAIKNRKHKKSNPGGDDDDASDDDDAAR